MKKATQFIFMLITVIALIFAGCKKGDTGPAGANGANGSNGSNGNANVKVFVFGPDTLSSTVGNSLHTLDSVVTQNYADSCVMLVYFELSSLHDFWFPSPGQPGFYSFLTTWYTGWTGSRTNMVFRITNLDGSSYTGGQQIFTRVKVILAPSSMFSGHRMQKPVDRNNYHEVMNYLGLPLD